MYYALIPKIAWYIKRFSYFPFLLTKKRKGKLSKYLRYFKLKAFIFILVTFEQFAPSWKKEIKFEAWYISCIYIYSNMKLMTDITCFRELEHM